MNKVKIHLSICLPTYNRFDYLRVTVNHLLRELEYVSCPYEIIVGDGGSTDGTNEFLEAIDKIEVFNGGLVDSCKIYFDLFSRSRGKYICLLSDKMLINIRPILRGLKIMEENIDFGLLTWKKSLFKSREPFTPSGIVLDDIIGSGDLCLFRRDDAMKYWAANYNALGCHKEFALRLFFSGKFIAYTKEVCGYEFKFRHYDYLHIKYRYQKRHQNADYNNLEEKLSNYLEILEADHKARTYKRIRGRIIASIFKLYWRLYKSDALIWLLLILFRQGDSDSYPSIPNDELPVEVGLALPGIFPENAQKTMKLILGNLTDHHSEKILSDVDHYLKTTHKLLRDMRQDDEWRKYFVEQKLDCRVNIKFMNKLYEWLYKNSCSYLYKCKKYDEDLYLMQKIPDYLVREFRRLPDYPGSM